MIPFRLRQAGLLLRRGAVVAYPTEAVFGLGCDPADAAAVRRILAIKQRSPGKGLILIGADFAQLQPWLQPVNDRDQATLRAAWPGPVTWLLPARDDTPVWLRGAHTTLAVRVTAHPVAAALCRLAGTALVSTSANVNRRPPARTALAVRRRLGRQVDHVVPGSVAGAARPSQIRTLDGHIIRS